MPNTPKRKVATKTGITPTRSGSVAIKKDQADGLVGLVFESIERPRGFVWKNAKIKFLAELGGRKKMLFL